MNYATIKKFDIANGPGVRVSLFVFVCRHKCKNCFNSEAWDFSYGTPFTRDTIDTIIRYLSPGHIKGLTLLGGEPFEPENQEGLIAFMRRVKKECPDKDVWAYTGYLLDEDLVEGGKNYTPYTDELLSYIDVLVDGPFVLELKSLMLKFKGSSNQRVIDMKTYRESGIIEEIQF